MAQIPPSLPPFPIYLQLIDGLTVSVLCLACSRTALSNSVIQVINEDTPASNCRAYLETFPEPGNEACQSLGDALQETEQRFHIAQRYFGTH